MLAQHGPGPLHLARCVGELGVDALKLYLTPLGVLLELVNARRLAVGVVLERFDDALTLHGRHAPEGQ